MTPELRLALFERDKQCIAPLVDRDCGPCSGRLTVEHVKAQLRTGRRAPSRLASMVSLCSGHTEDGRKAGYQWNTAKGNRALVRAYLESFEEAVA